MTVALHVARHLIVPVSHSFVVDFIEFSQFESVCGFGSSKAESVICYFNSPILNTFDDRHPLII